MQKKTALLSSDKRLVMILGPTAAGKTALAVKLAQKFNGEIISADSRQVYRGLDIGTGKDLAEYGTGKSRIRSHMIDICDPGQDYHLKQFCEDIPALVGDIEARQKIPFITGGSALYLYALLAGYTLPGQAPSPNLRRSLQNRNITGLQQFFASNYPGKWAEFSERNNRSRIIRAIEKAAGQDCPSPAPLPGRKWLILGVYYPRHIIHQRIEKRLRQRLAEGMIEEVRKLHENGLSWQRLAYFGLEYRCLSKYLQGELSYQEMFDQLLAKIRQFAKRQDIWFRKFERQGFPIYWLRDKRLDLAGKLISAFLKDEKMPAPEFKLSEHHYGPVSTEPISKL